LRALSAPAVSVVTKTPYVRLEGQLPVQNEYSGYSYFYFKYEEPEEFAIIYSLLETRGYLGGSAAAWDVTVPDLTSLAGFQSAWMIQPTQTLIDISAAAASGGLRALALDTPSWGEYRPWFLHGAVPKDGETEGYARSIGGRVQFSRSRWASAGGSRPGGGMEMLGARRDGAEPRRVLLPRHRRVVVRDLAHRDAAVHRTHLGAEVAPHARLVDDLHHHPAEFARHSADRLVCAIPTSRPAQLAADALFPIDVAD